jgi:hypothetical protein
MSISYCSQLYLALTDRLRPRFNSMFVSVSSSVIVERLGNSLLLNREVKTILVEMTLP